MCQVDALLLLDFKLLVEQKALDAGGQEHVLAVLSLVNLEVSHLVDLREAEFHPDLGEFGHFVVVDYFDEDAVLLP